MKTLERMQAIILMYKKAKAYEQLSGFYDACAQFEIDEYRAYDKALAALNEAERFLSKGEEYSSAKQNKKNYKRCSKELCMSTNLPQRKNVLRRIRTKLFVYVLNCYRNVILIEPFAAEMFLRSLLNSTMKTKTLGRHTH